MSMLRDPEFDKALLTFREHTLLSDDDIRLMVEAKKEELARKIQSKKGVLSALFSARGRELEDLQHQLNNLTAGYEAFVQGRYGEAGQLYQAMEGLSESNVQYALHGMLAPVFLDDAALEGYSRLMPKDSEMLNIWRDWLGSEKPFRKSDMDVLNDFLIKWEIRKKQIGKESVSLESRAYALRNLNRQ